MLHHNHKGQAKAGSATSELPSNRTQKHSLETGTIQGGNLKLRTAVDLHLTEKRRPYAAGLVCDMSIKFLQEMM